MLHPFFENTKQSLQYAFIWVIYALLQAFVLTWIVPIPFWMLLLDGVIHATVFGLLGLLLWSVVKYGNFSALTVYQRLVNHFALALLSLALWLSIGYGLIYWLLGENITSLLIPMLPIRGLIGLLIYLLIIQRFRLVISKTIESTESLKIEQSAEISTPKPTNQNEILERIAVKSGSKIHVVLVSEILHLQADGDYVQIFTAQGKYLKEQTMKFFEEHLPENQFVRVHRSVIVNVEMISRIELYEKQNQLLTLKNGQQIKTSPAGYKALRSVLNL